MVTPCWTTQATSAVGGAGGGGGGGGGAEKKTMQLPVTFAPLLPARGGLPAGAEVGQMGQRKSSITADLTFNASPRDSFC